MWGTEEVWTMLCCYTLSIHICLIMSYLCTTRVVGSWLRTAKKKKWSFSSQILAIFLDVLTSLLLVLKQNGLKFLGCLIDAALAPYIIICQKNSSLKYANFTPSLVHCILKHELYIGSIWKKMVYVIVQKNVPIVHTLTTYVVSTFVFVDSL